MKQWIVLGIILGCLSCFDDKGNYDYIPMNEIEVSGIPEDTWIEMRTYVDTLRFSPIITNSLYKDGEEPFTYEWKLMGLNSQAADTTGEPIDYTISRTKDLNYPLTEKSGDYCGFFWVRDTITGIAKKQDFYVRLKTSVSEGWMILCDENGEARLDMVSHISETEDEISRNIWADNDFTIGRPIRLCFSYLLQGSSRLVRTENGTWNMETETLAVGPDTDMSLMFGLPMSVVDMANHTICIPRTTRVELMVMDNGVLYKRNPIDYGDVFGDPINYAAETYEEFVCSPYMGCPYGSSSLEASVILYDETNQCFRELVDSYSAWNYPQELQLSSGTVSFDIHTGMELLFMETAGDIYTYAICGDNVNRQIIYGFEHGQGGFTYPRVYTELKRNERDPILKFAFSPINNYLFYLTNKNEVYQFDMDDPQTPAKLVLTFPGEQVSVLKFNRLIGYTAYQPWQLERENMLVVGSYKDGVGDGESGIMRLYEVPRLMGDLVLRKEFTSLGKIVDIVYKERKK